MFVATLLTAPSDRLLDPALVENLRNAWGGGDAHWLAPDEVAEFAMPRKPENHASVWDDLQQMGVDLVVQPAEGRKKKMLLADMDSTMIQQECIDELADEAGVGQRVKDITARAMNGELGFEGALIERVALFERVARDGDLRSVGQTDHSDAGGGRTRVHDAGEWCLCSVGVGRVYLLHFKDRR